MGVRGKNSSPVHLVGGLLCLVYKDKAVIGANTNIYLDEKFVLIGTNFLSIEVGFLDYLMSETDGG